MDLSYTEVQRQHQRSREWKQNTDHINNTEMRNYFSLSDKKLCQECFTHHLRPWFSKDIKLTLQSLASEEINRIFLTIKT